MEKIGRENFATNLAALRFCRFGRRTSLWDLYFFPPALVSNLNAGRVHISGSKSRQEFAMDLIMIGIGVVFFALATAYIRACENL